MTKRIDFTFSDLIAGYVTNYDDTKDAFNITTSDGREFLIYFGSDAYAEFVRNLGQDFQNATDKMRELLKPGRYVFAYGIFYPDGENDEHKFEAKHLVFPADDKNKYVFENQDWWIRQIKQLADFYLKAEFGNGPVNYDDYRTNLSGEGQKMESNIQEADTISRLVYGFASAFMMTGDDRYWDAAKKGTDYLREHLQIQDGEKFLWCHAVDIKEDGTKEKIPTSKFGDDWNAIPCYEQIYALAGPVQTFRITGDPLILDDAEKTLNLFEEKFKDKTEQGGYYSHIDYENFSPHNESLGDNRSKKNWNSVGDHAPAYLINLWLATGKNEYADFLEYTFDTIVEHFPDYDESPFVQERFLDNWLEDQTYKWQQNRAVIGHNLKIAWNLLRMYSLKPKKEYAKLAKKIAALMPGVGSDLQRGGWYDVVERKLAPGEKVYRYSFHDRKAWWQQEQAILAYLILNGVLKDDEYLRIARESSSFYNAWFLDTEVGGVYFNVLANGLPYALGTERTKGSHSMAGYHSFELAFLAAVYTNLLITKQPMDFFFKPVPGGFPDNILRVQPDILPPGSIKIDKVWIDNEPYNDFNADDLTVNLPLDHEEIKVKVRIVAVS